MVAGRGEGPAGMLTWRNEEFLAKLATSVSWRLRAELALHDALTPTTPSRLDRHLVDFVRGPLLVA